MEIYTVKNKPVSNYLTSSCTQRHDRYEFSSRSLCLGSTCFVKFQLDWINVNGNGGQILVSDSAECPRVFNPKHLIPSNSNLKA